MTLSSSSSTCTIHVLTPSVDEAFRAHLVSSLRGLHPEADVRVGSGSHLDVFVWSSTMTLPLPLPSPDKNRISRTSRTSLTGDGWDVGEDDFADVVSEADALAELVECECRAIEKAWKTSQRSQRSQRRLRSASLLATLVGMFQ
jgi:hypothetical protein